MLIWLPTTWRTPQVPKVVVFSFRFMLGLVYGYAGLAKLNADWLLHAQPLAMWIPQHSAVPLLGKFFALREVAFLFSWAGAAFDLVAPFALFSDRVRPYFYPILVTFHVLTWVLFPIGVFPWVMIACTTVFFTDSWHEALWAKLQKWLPHSKLTPTEVKWPSWKQVALVTFLLIQGGFPWRHLAYNGSVFWHEAGYRFGWRVMLMEKAGWTTFFIQNEEGEEREFPTGSFLTPNQDKMMSTQPDLMVQTAKHIRQIWDDAYGERVKVRAEVWASLNGRRSQLMVDPFEDLASLENGWEPRTFVLPLDSVIRPREFEAIKDSLRHARGW